MTDALEDHALLALEDDDIDGLAGEEEERTNLVDRLDKASTAYSIGISAGSDQADDKQHQWHQHRD